MYLLGTLQCVKFLCVRIWQNQHDPVPDSRRYGTRVPRKDVYIHCISLYIWRAGRKGFRQAGISERNSRIVQLDCAGS